MNRNPVPRWNPLVLGLGAALALGTVTLAQQGGSTSTGTPPSSGTAPAPTVPSTTSSGTSGSAAAASPAVLCGLTAQAPGRGTAGGATTGSGGTGSAGNGTGGSTGTGTGTAAGPGTGSGTGTSTGSGTGGTAGGTSSGTTGTGTGSAGAATGSNTSGARLSGTDTCFAQQAALSDLFELQSSQLAAAQGGNAKVKAFARQMIQDHTRTSQQLASLAPRLGLRLPTALEGPKLAEVAALRGQQGAGFDRAYMVAQVNAHEQAVNLFSAYSKLGGANAQLKAHAARTLPTLQKHLQAARELLQAVVK